MSWRKAGTSQCSASPATVASMYSRFSMSSMTSPGTSTPMRRQMRLTEASISTGAFGFG